MLHKRDQDLFRQGEPLQWHIARPFFMAFRVHAAFKIILKQI
jgi:hypothetical protein